MTTRTTAELIEAALQRDPRAVARLISLVEDRHPSAPSILATLFPRPGSAFVARSPFTGGAILGDRIRMQDHVGDPGVYIRSMGSRGHLGGVAEATPKAIMILDAIALSHVVLETVGAGQAEGEI